MATSHLQEQGCLNWFTNKQSETPEVISWMMQLQEEKPCSFFFSDNRGKKEVAEIGTLIEIWVKNFRRRADPNGQSAYKRCSTSLVIRNANQKCQELRHTMSHLLWSKTAWEVAWGCGEVNTAFAWHTKTNKQTACLIPSSTPKEAWRHAPLLRR